LEGADLVQDLTGTPFEEFGGELSAELRRPIQLAHGLTPQERVTINRGY
jgi:hypothetical protein